MGEMQSERGSALMQRLQDSGYAQLVAWSGYPGWLSVAVSQILAITGTDEILAAGHTVVDYNLQAVLDGARDLAEGRVQVLTADLLVVAEFSPARVRTRAVPLRAASAVIVTSIRDIMTKAGTNWPDRVAFDIEVAGSTYSFPPSEKSSSPKQYAELPAALSTVKAAIVQK